MEADRRSIVQALAVVVLSSLAAGIGARGSDGGAATLAFVANASVMALLTSFHLFIRCHVEHRGSDKTMNESHKVTFR